jgi:glycosyltransferase involved in cell wall biosynthesis
LTSSLEREHESGDAVRVALIAPPWVAVPPPDYGGTESVVDHLARGLRAAGHEVRLYATGDSSCDVDVRWVLDRAVGTESMRPGIELQHVVAAYDDVLSWLPDVVHDHTVAGPVYGSRFDLPVVTTNHGPFVGELGTVYRAIAGEVAVVAISRHQAGTAPEIPLAAVIHHGIDVDAMPQGAGGGGPAVFLGRMCPEKGVHVAIDIARQAGVPLQIAAKMREPAEHAYFDEVIRPRLGGDIEFVGAVGGSRKSELLAGASCLINPIAWPEPFGMVMIEALACGTPVVATPCGSAPELIDDGTTGFLRSDLDELAAAVTRVAEIDRNMCRKVAAERFSTTRMVDDHVRCYRQVIARHDGRSAPARSACGAHERADR